MVEVEGSIGRGVSWIEPNTLPLSIGTLNCRIKAVEHDLVTGYITRICENNVLAGAWSPDIYCLLQFGLLARIEFRQFTTYSAVYKHNSTIDRF